MPTMQHPATPCKHLQFCRNKNNNVQLKTWVCFQMFRPLKPQNLASSFLSLGESPNPTATFHWPDSWSHVTSMGHPSKSSSPPPEDTTEADHLTGEQVLKVQGGKHVNPIMNHPLNQPFGGLFRGIPNNHEPQLGWVIPKALPHYSSRKTGD